MAAFVDQQAIRSELEATRAAYHGLLASLAEDHWERTSGNPELTVKELMWHMAWSMGWMARSIDAVRAGKNLRLPSFLIEPGRKLAMRWLARRATPEATARKFDEGLASIVARTEALRDDEWQREASRLGETRTVEWYVRHVAEHFEEHARDVRAVIA